MTLSDGDLEHIERLARVELAGESRVRLREQLERIIEFVRRLQEVDTEEPGAGARSSAGAAGLRADRTEPCLDRTEVLAESPADADGFFVVPPVIDAVEP